MCYEIANQLRYGCHVTSRRDVLVIRLPLFHWFGRLDHWQMSRDTDDMPHSMVTSSNGNIFRVTGPLCGEFTGPGEFPAQRPVTRSFDVFFDLRLNKGLSKQPLRLVIWDVIVVIMTSLYRLHVWFITRHVRNLFLHFHPRIRIKIPRVCFQKRQKLGDRILKKTAEPRVNELIGAGLFWFNINGLRGLLIAQIYTYFVCIWKEQRTLLFLCLWIWNITPNSSSSIQKLIGLWCFVVFSRQ